MEEYFVSNKVLFNVSSYYYEFIQEKNPMKYKVTLWSSG